MPGFGIIEVEVENHTPNNSKGELYMTNFTLTVQDLASLEGIDYQTASGLLRFLREKGIAKEVSKRKKATKGRTATEYELPKVITLTFGELVTETPELDQVEDTLADEPATPESPVEPAQVADLEEDLASPSLVEETVAA
jgi:hypothetical protein